MHTNATKPYSPFRAFLTKFMKQRVAVAAGGIVLFMIVVALVGQWLVPYAPDKPVNEQYAAKGIHVEQLTRGLVNITGVAVGGEQVAFKNLPKLTLTSTHSEIAKASINGNGAAIIANSRGSTEIVVKSGEVAAALKVNVSKEDDGQAILSQLVLTKPKTDLKVGDSFSLGLSAVLSDSTVLSSLEQVEGWVQQSMPAGEQTKDNGFINSTSENSIAGIRFESLTPKLIRVSEAGVVSILREGQGLVKVTLDPVSSVLALPINVAPDPSIVEQLRPDKTVFALQDLYKHQPPSLRHWFGTDHANRDIFSRIVVGTRQTLIIGFVSVFIGAFIGILFGLIAGYYGRWIDTLISRGADIMLSFPGMLLAIFVIAVAGTGMVNVIFAVATFTVPIFIRIVRGSVLSLKEMTYVEAARSIGVTDSVIMIRHIFPGTLSIVMIYLTMRVGSAILIGAGLSYLGLGGDVTASEWGSMLSAAKNNSMTEFFPILFPGLAIVITVLSFNLFGDGLRDALDPKLRD